MLENNICSVCKTPRNKGKHRVCSLKRQAFYKKNPELNNFDLKSDKAIPIRTTKVINANSGGFSRRNGY